MRGRFNFVVAYSLHVYFTRKCVAVYDVHKEKLQKFLKEHCEASPHKRRLKCDTKHQSQEADATFITSDGSKPYKPWRTIDTDDNKD